MPIVHCGCDYDAGVMGPNYLPEKVTVLFYLVWWAQAVCTYMEMLVASKGMNLGTFNRPYFALRSMV